jgi:X-Pro dipeptidyl-peptidase
MRGSITRRDLLRAAGYAGVAAVATSAGAGEAVAVPNDDYETTTGKSEPRFGMAAAEQQYVETSYTLPDAKGGAEESPTLFGEIIWPTDPDTGEKVKDVPVILGYSPYNDIRSPQSEAASIAADGLADYYVPRGYARAVFDVVGCRNSGGCYDYGGYRERLTGKQLVEYLGGEPDAADEYVDRDGGSAGTRNVGMIGASYDGTTAIAAAVEDPDHLAAIIPQVAIDRWYDYAFGGGIRYFLNNEQPTDEGFDTPLAFDLGFGFVPAMNVQDPGRFAAANERRFTPCDAVEHTERAYEFDPTYDAFWERRDYRRRAGNVDCAVFLEAGWLDHNVKHWDSTRFFDALEGVPKKLVMGQWPHTSSQFADARDVRHAWFDKFLKGLDTGVTELPRVDTQTSTGERLQHEAMPPRGTSVQRFDLTRAEADQRSLALVGSGAPTYTDTQPPLTEEEMFATETSQHNHLKFESAPLDDRVRITGSIPLGAGRAPQLDLLASSTAASTHFTPVLYERLPDGSVEVATRGFLNARNRNGLDTSEPVPVGEPYRAPVELWDTDYVFSEGSRVGLVVASDNRDWCLNDPDGTATNEVVLGAPGASGGTALRLPVVDAGDADDGGDAPSLEGTRTDDGSVFTAGRTNRVELSVSSEGRAVEIRDRVPAGWEVDSGFGDVDRTESLEDGSTLVYLSGKGRTVEAAYFVEAPDEAGDSGQDTFGPVEARAAGTEQWLAVPGTQDTNTVVGAGIDL